MDVQSPRTRSINTTRLKAPALTKQQKAANRDAARAANIRTRTIGNRYETDRSILFDDTVDGLETRFHATKGWRIKRVAPAAIPSAALGICGPAARWWRRNGR